MGREKMRKVWGVGDKGGEEDEEKEGNEKLLQGANRKVRIKKEKGKGKELIRRTEEGG